MGTYTIAPLQIDITASKSDRAAAVRSLVAKVVPVTDPTSSGVDTLFRYLIWHESMKATTRLQRESGIARGLIQIQPNRLADTATRYLLGTSALDIAASLAFSAPTVPADISDALIKCQTQTTTWPDNDTRLSDWLSGAPPEAIVASDTFAVLLMRYDFRGKFSGGDPDLSDATACANVWADWWWRGDPAERPGRIAAFLNDAADYDASLPTAQHFARLTSEILKRKQRPRLYRTEVTPIPSQPIYDGDTLFMGVLSAKNLGWVETWLGQRLIKKIDDNTPGYFLLELQAQQYTELDPANFARPQELVPSGPTVLFFTFPNGPNLHINCSLQDIATAITTWGLDTASEVEFPYGLLLSPKEKLHYRVPSSFGDALSRLSQRLDMVMWHLKLEGTPLQLTPSIDATATPDKYIDPSITPGLSANDISQIVDSGLPVTVDRMILGSLGASADVSWRRVAPSAAHPLDAYAETTEVGRQVMWKHAATKVPFPTRHWMSEVVLWKREPAFDNVSVARLVRLNFIRLNQAKINLVENAARRLGSTSITLQTPSGSPLTAEIFPTPAANTAVS